MKKGPYCGKTYSDEAEKCSVDESVLVPSEPTSQMILVRKTEFTRRDKWIYGITSICFILGIILLLARIDSVGGYLSNGSIVYATLYAGDRGHLTNFHWPKFSSKKTAATKSE
jgi:hypothetical protein